MTKRVAGSGLRTPGSRVAASLRRQRPAPNRTLDSDGNGTIDQTTTYGYDVTQQTSKTVWQGTDTDPQTGTKLEETTHEFNLQGRMSKTEIDSDGNGDLESRLEYEYDDSGIRVAKTVTEDDNSNGTLSDDASERTDYHVDKHNHTGYAQVLEEMNGATGEVLKSYTFGLDAIEEAVAASQVRRLLKDGHGSTRQLVDALGNVIASGSTPQVYAYDAYGVPIGFTLANALTTLLYSGEMTDQLTGLQYLRARYYNPATGTFNRLDPFAGNFKDPQSLHKYLYTHGDPVNGWDPTGEFTIGGMMTSIGARMSMVARGAKAAFNVAWKVRWLVGGIGLGGTLFTILSYSDHEITPAEGIVSGFQLGTAFQMQPSNAARKDIAWAGLVNMLFEAAWQVGTGIVTALGRGNPTWISPRLTADLFHAFAEGAFDAAIDKAYAGWVKRYNVPNACAWAAFGVGVQIVFRDMVRNLVDGRTYTDETGEQWPVGPNDPMHLLLSGFLGAVFSEAAHANPLSGRLPPAVRKRASRFAATVLNPQTRDAIADIVVQWWYKFIGKSPHELVPEDDS